MSGRNNLLNEIKNARKPSFIPTEPSILHKEIAKQFKFKSRNQNAYNAQVAMQSMRNTLHDLIKNNRNNTTQKNKHCND